MREYIRKENSNQGIKAIFSDEKITKVLHSADSDLKYLISDFGIVTINMFDTSKALLFLQKIPTIADISNGKLQINKTLKSTSLLNLAQMTIGIEMDKTFQIADWRIRPIPQAMLDYARYDSHYLLAIYACLIKILAPDLFFPDLSLEKVLT